MSSILFIDFYIPCSFSWSTYFVCFLRFSSPAFFLYNATFKAEEHKVQTPQTLSNWSCCSLEDHIDSLLSKAKKKKHYPPVLLVACHIYLSWKLGVRRGVEGRHWGTEGNKMAAGFRSTPQELELVVCAKDSTWVLVSVRAVCTLPHNA